MNKATDRDWFGMAFTLMKWVLFSLVLVFVGIRPLQNTQEQIVNGTTPSSVRSQQYQAELQFAVCARDDDSIAPDKLDDFHKACAGYESLEKAYATRGVEPRRTKEK